jgi:hypothetical protein
VIISLLVVLVCISRCGYTFCEFCEILIQILVILCLTYKLREVEYFLLIFVFPQHYRNDLRRLLRTGCVKLCFYAPPLVCYMRQ